MTRTAHQSGSSSELTVGELNPGVTFSASPSLTTRDVVFQQRVAAGDHHTFESACDAVGHLGIAWLMVLDQHGFVATDFVEHAQLICSQRAARFDEVDDGLGNPQRDHDLDGSGQRHEVHLDT